MEKSDPPIPRKKQHSSQIRVVHGKSAGTREVWQSRRKAGSRSRLPDGRTQKVRKQSLPAFESLRRRLNQASPDSLKLVFRLVIPLFVTASAFVAGWLLLREAHPARRPAIPGGITAAEVSGQPFDAGSAADWKGMVPNEVVDHFLKAATPLERLKWIRFPDAQREILERFYTTGPGNSEKVADVKPMASRMAGKITYDQFLVSMASGKERQLCVVIDPEGAKVDFASYAESSSCVWEDIVNRRVPVVEEARVALMAGNYYQEPFRDDHLWRHFTAMAPGQDDSVDLYVAADTRMCRILQSLCGQSPLRVTLSLRRSGDETAGSAYEIIGLRAVGWVVGDASISD